MIEDANKKLETLEVKKKEEEKKLQEVIESLKTETKVRFLPSVSHPGILFRIS